MNGTVMSDRTDPGPSPDDTKVKLDTSAARVLKILDLFTREAPVWTANDIAEALDLHRSTAYRYVRTLYEGGFLASAAGGGYVLGPKLIELDRQIQLSDPLLQAARPIMSATVPKTRGVVQLLCGFYGDRVLTVHQEVTDNSIESTMERGRPFPLFLGAPSKAILAFLPGYQSKNLLLNYPKEIAAAGLGQTWAEFRAHQKAIRKDGYVIASDLRPDHVGIATPVFRAPNAVVGSYCLAMQTVALEEDSKEYFIKLALSVGKEISRQLQAGLELRAPNGAVAALPTVKIGR